MQRKDIFDPDTFESIQSRIRSLTSESQPLWGVMNVAQMLAHCAEVQDVTNGKPLKGTPWFVKLIGGFIKKTVISENPYPKNLRTHPQYIMRAPEDFEKQRERLVNSLKTMNALDRMNSKHPIFGPLSPHEKGWLVYKHLDHHLSQFGA